MDREQRARLIVEMLNPRPSDRDRLLQRTLRLDDREAQLMFARLRSQVEFMEKSIEGWMRGVNGGPQDAGAKDTSSQSEAPWVKNSDRLLTEIRIIHKNILARACPPLYALAEDIIMQIRSTLLRGSREESVKDIADDLKAYIEIQSERMVRDMAYLSLGSQRTGSREYRRSLNSYLSMIFEPDTLVENPRRVKPTQAISGLAKLAYLTIQHKPDVLVTTSAGGKMLADFLLSHNSVGLKIPLIHNEALKSRMASEKLQGLNPQKILIIDSTARTGKTLQDSIVWVEEVSPTSDVHATCMAATFKARANLSPGRFLPANVTSEDSVKLPWETRGRVYVEAPGIASHFLGVPKAEISGWSSGSAPVDLVEGVFKLENQLFEKEYSDYTRH